jgi:Dolichyl-phosphate-mannose-protein mannosyltransferase
MKLSLANWSICLLLIGCLIYGFSLDRYPGFYIDDVFFAYPALKAALGGPFAYAVSSSAPFGNQLWAYHGPVFPHLLELLFKLFGFSTVVSRLPNFLGGWIAAATIVLFLKSRGYRYAGFAFAILWCGDRAPQELMYARMDGLALLCLVLAFVFLGRAWRQQSASLALLVGFFCGFSTLLNPLCILFAVFSFLLVFYCLRWKGAGWFALGGLLNVPVLLALWGFKVREPLAQFLWHAHRLQNTTAIQSFFVMLAVLRWSRYWFIALLIYSVICLAIAAVWLMKQGGLLDQSRIDFVIAAGFGIAALPILFRPSTHPYYIIYFSVWPMLCLVMLAEKHWRQTRYLAVGMAVIWCSSAVWNGLRLREAFLFHAQLGKQFLYSELRKNVPLDATVITTPELYSAPVEAGYAKYGVTSWFAEHQDICADCYLLMQAAEFRDADYISRTNLDQRRVLYSGPAFPGAGMRIYPVVLLSPEVVVGASDQKTVQP